MFKVEKFYPASCRFQILTAKRSIFRNFTVYSIPQSDFRSQFKIQHSKFNILTLTPGSCVLSLIFLLSNFDIFNFSIEFRSLSDFEEIVSKCPGGQQRLKFKSSRFKVLFSYLHFHINKFSCFQNQDSVIYFLFSLFQLLSRFGFDTIAPLSQSLSRR